MWIDKKRTQVGHTAANIPYATSFYMVDNLPLANFLLPLRLRLF